jgi:hypothetical protein
MSALTGTVTIGSHVLELPEAEARNLFLLAAAAGKRGNPLAISEDVMVAVTPGTPVALSIPGGFVDDYNPGRDAQRLLSPQQRTVRI